jgi:hypothetical protein
MDTYQKLPTALRLKVLNHFRNPECDHLDIYWKSLQHFKRQDLLASLNRYNYFHKHRKPLWDKILDEDNVTGIAFDFATDYSNEDYLNALQNGQWFPRGERLKGAKLRVTLFNMLEGAWWGYHGDIDTPVAIEHTIYDSLETKRDIERDFNVSIPNDRGHPPLHFDEWTKCCGENGHLPVTKRKYFKAPRSKNGRWNSKKAAVNIKKIKKNDNGAVMLIKRTWSRWRVDGAEAKKNYSYWELRYP